MLLHSKLAFCIVTVLIMGGVLFFIDLPASGLRSAIAESGSTDDENDDEAQAAESSSAAVISSDASSAALDTVVPPSNASSSESPAQAQVIDGRIEFESIPQQLLDSFLRAAFKDEILRGAPFRTEESDEITSKSAWDGNRISLSANVKRALLRFKLPEALQAEEGGQVPSYDIVIDFNPGEMLISTSRPFDPRRGNSIRIGARGDTQGRIVLRGKSRTSVAILSPRVTIGDQDLQAVLICPRYLHRTKGKAYLRDSSYRVARTMFSVDGSAEGRALTGGGIGYASAQIRTSANVPRSKSSSDQTYLKDPYISLNYIPLTREALHDTSGEMPVSAGIQCDLALQRPAGYKRHSTARSVVWVHEIMVGPENVWTSYHDLAVKQAVVQPGPCYVVAKQGTLHERFSREEFKLPERLQ